MGYVNNREDLIGVVQRVFEVNKYNTSIAYLGNSITIDGKEDDTNVYMRLYDKKDGLHLDISNISLDESIQRKGYFTKLVNMLLDTKVVVEVIVSSVLTECMHKACSKNGFEESDIYEGYTKRN